MPPIKNDLRECDIRCPHRTSADRARQRDERISSGDAATLAHITNPVDDVVQEIRDQVRLLQPG
jgi:hypothetical protein